MENLDSDKKAKTEKNIDTNEKEITDGHQETKTNNELLEKGDIVFMCKFSFFNIRIFFCKEKYFNR